MHKNHLHHRERREHREQSEKQYIIEKAKIFILKNILFYIFFFIAFLRDLCVLCGEIYE